MILESGGHSEQQIRILHRTRQHYAIARSKKILLGKTEKSDR